MNKNNIVDPFVDNLLPVSSWPICQYTHDIFIQWNIGIEDYSNKQTGIFFCNAEIKETGPEILF